MTERRIGVTPPVGGGTGRAMLSFTAHRLVATEAHEGPVYVADEHALYVTTERGIRRVDLSSLSVEDLHIEVVRPNGMCLDLDGTLLVCEQGDHDHPARIARLDRRSGRVETVVDELRGLPLNSPNDVVVGADDLIYASCGRGVQIFTPDGDLVAEIDLPGAVNFTFGGAHHDTLYITADTAVYTAAPRITTGVRP